MLKPYNLQLFLSLFNKKNIDLQSTFFDKYNSEY
jgi:hypothetical protein